MKIGDMIIKPHAIERFEQRYEALTGVQLNGEELRDRLCELIAEAAPEEENLTLTARRDAYGGIGTYFVNPPWRFVFSNKALETCEIAPQEMLFVENPYIPDYSVKTKFFIKIKIKQRRSFTEITRSYDKKTLHLRNKIETIAIINALRILGIRVNQFTEPNRLEIIIPQNIGIYRIQPFARPENVLISLGRTESFPLGRQKANCQGILKPDLEKILDFLQISEH